MVKDTIVLPTKKIQTHPTGNSESVSISSVMYYFIQFHIVCNIHDDAYVNNLQME